MYMFFKEYGCQKCYKDRCRVMGKDSIGYCRVSERVIKEERVCNKADRDEQEDYDVLTFMGCI